MRISISIGSAYYNGEEWDSLVDYTMAADRMGVNEAWSAEAWGMDAIVPLAYLAAKTENIRLGTGIMQVSARVPSMIAMTAQSLDTVSKGRFNLGLGVSGPQVVEGLHGAAFAKPLSRMRECMAILRMALKGDKLQYEGEHYHLPRPGGEGKPIRLSQPPRPDLPIYLATLGPKSLQMTGEIADGWLPLYYSPYRQEVYADQIENRPPHFEIMQGLAVNICDDVEQGLIPVKHGLALYIGGMGAKSRNSVSYTHLRAHET